MSSGRPRHNVALSFALILALLLSFVAPVSPVLAADGDGSMTVSPASVLPGSTGNNLVFTFLLGSGQSLSSSSRVRVTVPSGWTAPSGHVATSNWTCSGTRPDPTTSGSDIYVYVDPASGCSAGQGFTLNYTNVSAPSSTSLSTFTTYSRSGSTGETTIATSPVVVVANAVATAYFDSALTSSRTIFGDGGTAYVVVTGLPASLSDWTNRWNATGLNCANTGGADRPDSSATGRVPYDAGNASSYLRYPPVSSAEATWNTLSNYENSICNAMAAGNEGQWTLTLSRSAGSITVPVFTVDATAPTVTINQAAGQVDPANTGPINFTVVFSEAVTGFATGDVAVTGTAGGSKTAMVTMGPTTFNVAVSGLTTSGTVIATIGAEVAQDAAGNGNAASTSTDNTVTWNPDTTPPTVTIEQAAGQVDPAKSSPVNFTVVFSETVADFSTGDVTLSSSTTPGALVGTVTGSGTTYNVAVSGMTGSGTVTASIAAGAAHDAANNASTDSTSTDNTVTFDNVAPTASIDSHPTDPSASDAATFTFSGSDPTDNGISSGLKRLECQLDGVEFATCTSPASFTSLAETSHTFQVRAVDNAGNTGSAASYTWTVDVTPPTVTIEQAAAQADPTGSSPINFTVVFSEPVSDFTSSDVTLEGTALATTAVVSGSVTTYNVAVSGMGVNGTVIASLEPGVAHDAAGNPSEALIIYDNTVTYQKAGQTITVTTGAPGTVGYNWQFTVAATASSGLPVAYSAAGVCTNVGPLFTMTSPTGTCTVQYDQAGNAFYNPAPQLTQDVTATKCDQTITVNTHAPTNAAYHETFPVAATASSALPVAYSVTGNCSLLGTNVTMTSPTGTCTVQYDQAGDDNFNAAPQVTETVNAQMADQTITVATHAPASAVYGQTFTVAATASSSLAVVYSVDLAGACSYDGTTVTMTSATGTCTGWYDQPGDVNYNAAPRVTELVAAQKAATTTAINSVVPAGTVVGEAYTVSYSVSVNAPGAGVLTGDVTVSDGSQSCTADWAAGSCSLTATTAGAKTLTATYAGDGNFLGSSATTPHTVDQAATTTTVATIVPSETAVGVAYPVNYSVLVTLPGSGSPTGNVTVSDGTDSCTGTVAAGTCLLTSTTVGAKTVTATYAEAEDSNFQGSSGSAGHQVGQATGSLMVADKSAAYGSTVTLEATLTPAVAGKSVSFTVAGVSAGPAVLTNASGLASRTYTVTNPVAGSPYTIEASFAAGDDHITEASDTGALAVVIGDQTISVTTHAPASAAYNASFAVAATASSGLPVAYSVTGNCTIAVATVTMTSGTGTCSVLFDQVGDANYNAAPQVVETVTAQRLSQTITVTTPPPASAVFGTTFTVAGTASSGLAVAYSAAGSCSNVGATFTMTSGTGTCTVQFNQAGDSNYNAATQVTRPVTAQRASTTTAIVSSLNPSGDGQSVTFTATVTGSGGTPAGSVNFRDGSSSISGCSSRTLTGGQATCTTIGLSQNAHTITAVYTSTDSYFLGGTSSALTQDVVNYASTTSVSSSPRPSTFGQSVTFTSTVTRSGGSYSPTGTVTFSDGGATLGTCTLSGSVNPLSCTYFTSSLSAGVHTITAYYGGNPASTGGTGASTGTLSGGQTVNTASSTMAVVSSLNPANVGDTVTFTATVSPQIAGTVPTGTVTFFDDATSLGTGTLNASRQATLATSALAVGSHSITAIYGGDGNFIASLASSPVTQAVNAVPAKLAFVQQPPNPAVAGSVFSLAVTVEVQDSDGNKVAGSTASVTVAIGTDPSGGTATLSGTKTVAAVNGLATSSTLSIDKAGAGYTLAASSGVLTGATSDAFEVRAAAASVLVVAGFPSPTTSGEAHDFTVTARDPYGNVGVGYTGVIHISSSDTLAVLPADYQFLAGDNGSKTFSATLKTAGTRSLTATATTGTPAITGTQSGGIQVNAAPASRLAFAGQPTSSQVNAVITPAVRVEIQDAGNQVVTSDSTTQVTLTIGANPSGGTLSGTTTRTALSGVATFDDLSIDTAGTPYQLHATSSPAFTAADSATFSIVSPTRAAIGKVDAYAESGKVYLQWETTSEEGTVGFSVYRLDKASGQFQPVHQDLLPGFYNTPVGGTYRLLDPGAQPGGTYTYRLVEQEHDGKQLVHGPYTVTAAAGQRPALQSVQPGFSRSLHAPQASQAAPAGVAVQAAAQAQAASGAAKIVVQANGLYYVDGAAIASALRLQPAGVTNLIKNNRLQLSNRGQSVWTQAATGNAGLYFYGEAVDSRYTDANVYWLKVGSGQAMARQTVRSATAVAGQSFVEKLHAERDNPVLDMLSILTDPSGDFLAWDYLVAGNSGKQFEVVANGATRQGTATLTAHLQGGTASGAGHDHHAVVKVNGTQVGEGTWQGERAYDLSLTFDAALLREGANSVEVQALLDGGVPYSVFFVDSFDLSYQRYYRAVNDRLLASGGSKAVLTIEGFTSQNVMVFDVTNPLQPRALSGFAVQKAGGTYRVTFRTVATNRAYLAQAGGTAATPVADQASSLKTAANGADYLLITTAGLRSAAEEYAAYRAGEGLGTKVVDVQDVYDEFNSGLVSPEAIKSFLAYAYGNWRPSPRYVVLVGDGSFDYKNVGGANENLLPPLLVGTENGVFASDGRFGDVVGDDGVPEMAVGRLPVTTAAELRAYLDKVKAFEATPGEWLKKVLLLADDPDGGLNFPADSDAIGGLIPGSYSVQKVYLTPQNPAQAHADAVAAIKSGVSLVHYVGHGNPYSLAREGLLTVDDVKGALDGPVSPVLTAMSCQTNEYYIPGFETLGEALVVRQGGGAMATWAPTGLSDNGEAAKLDRAFIQAAFAGSRPRLGDATTGALKSYAAGGGQRTMLDLYVLLGDPALRLR